MEEEILNKMSRKFARKYRYLISKQEGEERDCENPLCKHPRIRIHVTLMSKEGECVVIGNDCFKTWLQLSGLGRFQKLTYPNRFFVYGEGWRIRGNA